MGVYSESGGASLTPRPAAQDALRRALELSARAASPSSPAAPAAERESEPLNPGGERKLEQLNAGAT